jgi:hypothetical protein
MTLPTTKSTMWVLMRVGYPVPAQDYGKVSRNYALERAERYVKAMPFGQYELVGVEHIEREVRRIPMGGEGSPRGLADRSVDDAPGTEG